MHALIKMGCVGTDNSMTKNKQTKPRSRMGLTHFDELRCISVRSFKCAAVPNSTHLNRTVKTFSSPFLFFPR